MDSVEFTKKIPAEKVAQIFKDFFEQHMFAHSILKDIEFVTINEVNINKASIMYSVKLLDTTDKDHLLDVLRSRSASLCVCGQTYTPEIYLNGDLLCITINK